LSPWLVTSPTLVVLSARLAKRSGATPSSSGMDAIGNSADTSRPAIAVLRAPRAMSSASSAAGSAAATASMVTQPPLTTARDE
jgi:hypothetical protein